MLDKRRKNRKTRNCLFTLLNKKFLTVRNMSLIPNGLCLPLSLTGCYFCMGVLAMSL